ncbi:unnamed protein product [Gordionus sp. m RMFG-2023]
MSYSDYSSSNTVSTHQAMMNLYSGYFTNYSTTTPNDRSHYCPRSKLHQVWKSMIIVKPLTYRNIPKSNKNNNLKQSLFIPVYASDSISSDRLAAPLNTTISSADLYSYPVKTRQISSIQSVPSPWERMQLKSPARKQISERRRKRMKRLLRRREFIKLKNVIPSIAHKPSCQIDQIKILNEATRHIKELEKQVLQKLSSKFPTNGLNDKEKLQKILMEFCR